MCPRARVVRVEAGVCRPAFHPAARVEAGVCRPVFHPVARVEAGVVAGCPSRCSRSGFVAGCSIPLLALRPGSVARGSIPSPGFGCRPGNGVCGDRGFRLLREPALDLANDLSHYGRVSLETAGHCNIQQVAERNTGGRPLEGKKIPSRHLPERDHDNSGNDLLSHTFSRVVPSALEGLTAEFGMGSGVTPPLWSPEVYILTAGSPAGAGSSSRGCGREVSGLHHMDHDNSGNDLLSHTFSRVVPSALEGLTAEFGMGSGVTPPLWSPEVYILTSGSPAGAESSPRRCGGEVSGIAAAELLIGAPGEHRY